MPSCACPTDDTLGSTLGNFGQALANNLNPMTMFRGQVVLAKMQQRQWELQHQQALTPPTQTPRLSTPAPTPSASPKPISRPPSPRFATGSTIRRAGRRA